MTKGSDSLVSIIIPTRNSGRTLESCLLAIKNQSYKEVETIIVDSESSDNTIDISKEMKCKIIHTGWKLLGARYEGLKASKGGYILMLDSDQLLKEDTVERSLALIQEYDMLLLEETSNYPETFIQKLFEADRRLIHRELAIQKDPVRGTLLARFYKRSLLENAFRSVPETLLPIVIQHDHAIIYYEAWKLSNKVGLVPTAVSHNEVATLRELWAKNFRYGRSTKKLLENGHYNSFIRKKTYHLRQTSGGLSWDKLLSSLLLLFKGPPYLAGLYL